MIVIASRYHAKRSQMWDCRVALDQLDTPRKDITFPRTPLLALVFSPRLRVPVSPCHIYLYEIRFPQHIQRHLSYPFAIFHPI